MKIRLATMEDCDAIVSLWRSCFPGDREDAVRFYLDHRFKPDFTALLTVKKDVIGMIHLLPCLLYPDKKALYWYASGIREDMRGRGYFRRFALSVLSETQKRGFANVCVPAPGLTSVYRNFGFSYPYTANESIVRRKDAVLSDQRVTFSNAAPEDFLNSDPNRGDVLWDLSAIRYAFRDNEFYQGKELKFYDQGHLYRFFAVFENEIVTIENHNISEEVFIRIQSSLFEELSAETIRICFSGNTKIIGLSDSKLVTQGSKISMSLA